MRVESLIIANCPECDEECHKMVCHSCNHEFDHPGIKNTKELQTQLKAKDKIIENMQKKLDDTKELKNEDLKQLEEDAFRKGKLKGYEDHKERMDSFVDEISEDKIMKDQKISTQLIQIKTLEARLKKKEAAELEVLEEKLEEKVSVKYKAMLSKAKTDHSIEMAAIKKEMSSMREKQEAIVKHDNLRSQELQGEAGQIHIRELLQESFPEDEIISIKRGARGADFHQRIFKNGKSIATILIEVKNTINNFQSGWVPKLENDLMTSEASVAILVCHSLPEDPFKYSNRGIFLTTYEQFQSLVATLRVTLFRERRLIKNNENKNEKAAIIFEVLTSEKFANQVRRLFEIYKNMSKRIEKDFQFHTKSAAARKAELENFGHFMMDFLGFLEGQGDHGDFKRLAESFEFNNEEDENVSIAFSK